MPGDLVGPICFHETIDPAWTDYNGHLNVAYYALAFDRATDHFLEFLGIGATYAASGVSTFAMEAHTIYLQEVQAHENVRVLSRLIGIDHKKIHYFHEMRRGDDRLAATLEQISIHVSLTTRRSERWPDAVRARLEEVAGKHGHAALPPQIGARISLHR